MNRQFAISVDQKRNLSVDFDLSFLSTEFQSLKFKRNPYSLNFISNDHTNISLSFAMANNIWWLGVPFEIQSFLLKEVKKK